MHYRYKIAQKSKINLAKAWLKSLNGIGIYSIEEGTNIIIGCFSENLPKSPSFMKFLSAEEEFIDWGKQWDEKIINIEIASTSFKLKAGPGFGDANHPTTKLCLNALADINPKEVIDIGSGSGILSIAAHVLGVKNIIAIEIDNQAIDHHKENLKLNNIETMTIRNYLIEEDLKNKDSLVLINMILSEQKEVFASIPSIFNYKKNWYVSGILREDIDFAINYYKDLGFEIKKIDHLEKWSGILMKKS